MNSPSMSKTHANSSSSAGVRATSQRPNYTLNVLVENKPGVLARVTTLISRRAYNIQSLTVAPSDNTRFSRINMVVEGDESVVEQIVKQLFKLIHVVKINELHPNDATCRELLMVTIDADPAHRGQIIELVNIYGAEIIDVGSDQLSISLTDDPARIDDFLALVGEYGISETQRTGALSIPRLTKIPNKLRSVTNGKAS